MKLIPFLLVSLFCFSGKEIKHSHGESFLPENQLHLEDSLVVMNGMTEEKFHAITDEVIAFYAPLVTAHGATLVASKNWQSSTVNASADQKGKIWKINMYGGLARRAEVTEDGFAAVVCHEVGHHFAGFPFYETSHWAGSEGQADYFAMHSCARNIWGPQGEENAKHRLTVHPIAKEKCDSIYLNNEEQNLCYRMANASTSLANLLSRIGSGSTLPSFETPDQSIVQKTYTSHPKAQCRLDTYLSGAVCAKPADVMVIPGKKFAAKNSLEAETESALYVCTDQDGNALALRPTCWFKPRF